jgi:O-antigen/teichoic acid export membrane protein
MANVYYVGGQRLDGSEALSQSLVVGALASALAAAFGHALTVTCPSLFAIADLSLFRLSLAWIPFCILNMYLSHICLGLGDTLGYTLVVTLPRGLFTLGLVIATVSSGMSVQSALLAQIAAEALSTISAVVWLTRCHGCRPRALKWSRLRESLGYGIRFYLGKLCSVANIQVSNIILAFVVRDAAMVGMFTAASTVFSRIWVLAEALQVAALPRTVAQPGGRPELIAQVVRLCLACCGLATLSALLLSKPIIVVVLSPRFLPVLVPVWILLPGILARVIAKILPAYFAGTNRPQVTSAVMGISIVVNLGLMYVLLPVLGLSGVALSMTIAYIVESVLLSLAFRRNTGLSLLSLVRISSADWSVLTRNVRRLLGRPQAGPHAPGAPDAE